MVKALPSAVWLSPRAVALVTQVFQGRPMGEEGSGQHHRRRQELTGTHTGPWPSQCSCVSFCPAQGPAAARLCWCLIGDLQQMGSADRVVEHKGPNGHMLGKRIEKLLVKLQARRKTENVQSLTYARSFANRLRRIIFITTQQISTIFVSW